MPTVPPSPPSRSSMQPSRPAPTPPGVGGVQQSPNGSPVRRSPSSPYPSRSEQTRPVITTIPSSGAPISELVPQRPAPRPPPGAQRISNSSRGHSTTQSLSSLSASPIHETSRLSPPVSKRPPPPLATNSYPITPPMQHPAEISGISQSARFPSNGSPATPNHRSRRSDSRKSDGASPQNSRGSPRAHSDEYGSAKSDKSIFGKFVSGMTKGLGSSSSKKEKMEISTPYDPVHLTHVGFNYHTGEFTV
jgi:p21-activated kinase 1